VDGILPKFLIGGGWLLRHHCPSRRPDMALTPQSDQAFKRQAPSTNNTYSLDSSNGHAASVRINWPPLATVCPTAQFDAIVATITRTLSSAVIELAAMRAAGTL
jgi:hypothetical protein